MQSEHPLIVKCNRIFFLFLAICFTSSLEFFIKIQAIYMHGREEEIINKKIENHAIEQ